MGGRDFGVSKLYIGNLPLDTTEKIFTDHLAKYGELNMNRITSIIIKRGYGFIECADQITADLIIDKFHSAPFYGALLNVEPAVPNKNGREPPVRVVFSTADNQGLTMEDVQEIITKWGGQTTSIHRRADTTGTHGGTPAFIATLAKGQSADELVSKFNGQTSKLGALIKVKVVGRVTRTDGDHERDDLKNPVRSRSFTRSSFSSIPACPLRVLVPADMIGAIIGKGGDTIREITASTGARVDIHKTQTRRNYSGSDKVEKIVTITGEPDNASQACRRILEILVEDVNKTMNNSEANICLRILAYNSLIGRVIGKAGCNIRKIMQDTQTKIQISNQTEYQTSFWNGFKDVDRIITIRGSVEGMSNAESLVSEKLRVAFETDFKNKSDVGARVDTRGFQMRNIEPMDRFPVFQSDQRKLCQDIFTIRNAPYGMKLESTTSFIYVPQGTIGSLIGTGGATIREMNRTSGATIKIERPPEGSNMDDMDGERRITIHGPVDAHARAQWLIFDRIRNSGLRFGSELKLTIEIMIPSRYVGRLIGKAGQRIQELQQQTSTMIKFVPFHSSLGDMSGDSGFMLARMHGTCFHVLTAEGRLRSNLLAIKMATTDDELGHQYGQVGMNRGYNVGKYQGIVAH